MTEAEWLAYADSFHMLSHLGAHATGRKLRLFSCARCRQLWHLFTDQRCRLAVEVAERFADNEATWEELNAADGVMWAATSDASRLGRRKASTRVATSAVASSDLAVGWAVWESAWDLGPDAEETKAMNAAADLEAPLLRNIFGNPFRPVTFDPAWRTDTAVALGSQMYESRDFGAMPILADALQDAGCTSDDILNHCRGPGPHVRGCWVVDLVLGKS